MVGDPGLRKSSKTRQISDVDRSWEKITQADADAAVQAAHAPVTKVTGLTPGDVDAEQEHNSRNAAPPAPPGTDAKPEESGQQDAGRGGQRQFGNGRQTGRKRTTRRG